MTRTLYVEGILINKTIILSQMLYQTLKKSFPFSSIFSAAPVLTEEELFSTQTPCPYPGIYVKDGFTDLTKTALFCSFWD
jgi:hypothetical protein